MDGVRTCEVVPTPATVYWSVESSITDLLTD
jgi:hypothetical protein